MLDHSLRLFLQFSALYIWKVLASPPQLHWLDLRLQATSNIVAKCSSLASINMLLLLVLFQKTCCQKLLKIECNHTENCATLEIETWTWTWTWTDLKLKYSALLKKSLLFFFLFIFWSCIFNCYALSPKNCI